MVKVVTDGRPFEHLFRRALKRFDLLTPEFITEKIADGTMQCFLFGESVVVTQIEQFPNGRALRVILSAGKNMPEWIDAANEFVEGMARLNGCRMLLSSGRPGWKSEAKKHGWKVFNEYRKELT